MGRHLSDVEARAFGESRDAIRAALVMAAEMLRMRSTFITRQVNVEGPPTVVAAYNAPGGCGVREGQPAPTDSSGELHSSGIGSYLAIPLVLSDGRLFGALCGVDPEPSDLLNGRLQTLQLIGRLLITCIEQEERFVGLDGLVAELGHELRNPIASLVGFGDLLQDDTLPEAQRREALETLSAEGQRLATMLQEFLSLRRLDRGRGPRPVVPTDLEALVGYAERVASNDPSHPVTVTCRQVIPMVAADPDGVQQVLANLLSNARKYSPAGGPIRIDVKPVGETVEVSVADEGLGMPREALNHVFDEFYRINSADRRGIVGTGLGLAICRHIVESYGGRIWAESRGPGRGSRFTFSLPIARQNPSTHGHSQRRLAGVA
jgi:signal transduction histidine kinase